MGNSLKNVSYYYYIQCSIVPDQCNSNSTYT